MVFKVNGVTVIDNTKQVLGNQTGRSGTISTALNSGNLIVTLDQSTGKYFNFIPDYTGVSGNIRFDFGNSPIKHYEFYVFWHNYQDAYNDATNTFNNYQTVGFKNGVGTLNNSNTGLFNGFTQVFKFITLDTGSSYYGSAYMRNC